jgi:hypothetical protein
VEGDLSPNECEVILKALGAYQIRLYDQFSTKGSGFTNATTSSPVQSESDLVTSAIKKIHRRLEDMKKNAE